MQGALTALNRSIIGWMRSLFLAKSSSTSVPENQPPQSVTSASFRIGSITFGSLGKRRPISMPVKPAERDWRRHSSSDTSSLNSTRSSFHHAMGDMPSLAFKSSLQYQVRSYLLLLGRVAAKQRGEVRRRPPPGPSVRPPHKGGGGPGFAGINLQSS